MIAYQCDGCGRELKKGALRYRVKIDVRAAYDELQIGLADLVRDHRQELLDLIEQLSRKDPSKIEEGIYKGFELDLCPACQRAYIRNPLKFHPEQGAETPEIDIDGFLRSLGKAPSPEGDSGPEA